MTTQTVLRKNRQVAWRAIADEAVLVPSARSQSEVRSAFVLNETAARVWALLDGIRPLGEIQATIIEEFDVDDREAASDLQILVERLLTLGVLEEVVP